MKQFNHLMTNILCLMFYVLCSMLYDNLRFGKSIIWHYTYIKMNTEIIDISLNKRQLFTSLGLFWIGLGWLGLLLSIFGIFYKAVLIIYILSGAVLLIYLLIINRKKIVFNKSFFLVSLLSLIAIFVFSYYTTPTIFSGRDQGSLSEAAIRLSQNHTTQFSFPASQEFFKIYGLGKALNFPGLIIQPKET